MRTVLTILTKSLANCVKNRFVLLDQTKLVSG